MRCQLLPLQRKAANAVSSKTQTFKRNAAPIRAAARLSVALFATTTCRLIAEPQRAVAVVNVALFETMIYRPCAALLLAVAVASAASFAIQTCRPFAAHPMGVAAVNVALSETMTFKPCAAHKMAAVQVNADLSETLTCRRLVALNFESGFKAAISLIRWLASLQLSVKYGCTINARFSKSALPPAEANTLTQVNLLAVD